MEVHRVEAQFIFIVILVIILLNFIFERYLDFLNDSWKKSEIPLEAQGIYDEEKYRKWLDYDRAGGQLSKISGIVQLSALLIFLLLDGFDWWDDWLRTNLTEDPIWLALAFFGGLMVGSSILSTPFALYRTFVIEEKFGFNRITWKVYLSDRIKGLVLGVIIGGGLGYLVIWFYYSSGPLFWLYAWGLMVAFLLFQTMFFASWILPLFNKLTPLPEGELRSAIVQYCQKVNFQLDNLYVMDGSKRSSKANAFFSGLGPRKRIVLYDTLIENLDTDEVVGVLAHEIGHYKRKHTRSFMFLSIFQTGIMLYILSLVLGSPEEGNLLLSAALGSDQASFHLGIVTFGMLYTPLSVLLGLLFNVLSRKFEFEADAYAGTTFRPEPLMSSLKKLAVDHLANLKPHPIYVYVYYSHPPLLQRLNALNKLLQQNPKT